MPTNIRYQYLVIGDFLIYDKKADQQKLLTSINEVSHSPEDADRLLETRWDELKRQKHNDLRFMGVIYKAEVHRLFC